jgi:hypothetical protein
MHNEVDCEFTMREPQLLGELRSHLPCPLPGTGLFTRLSFTLILSSKILYGGTKRDP